MSMKMEQTECFETSAYNIQTPGNRPKERIQHSQHGDRLKSRIMRYMRTCMLPESSFTWVETCSCHLALNSEQLVADGCLLASFYSVLSVCEPCLNVKYTEVPRGSRSNCDIKSVGGCAGVVRVMAVRYITVTCICDLHLVFGPGPGWLRRYCSWLSIRRGEAEKKGAKMIPCPLIHPALHATALGIGWSATDL